MSKTSPIWYPFTQMKTAAKPFKVVSGEGAMLTLEDGREIIDAISSWWVNVLGHCQPDIAQAISEQVHKLEHVIFAGFTHEPAEELAQKILKKIPTNLSKVFFSDNGSTAVEVALKLAYQYWRNKGENNRTSFLCFEGGYHGDTLGAMSMGSCSLFTNVFQDLLFDVSSLPFPDTFESDVEVEEKEARSLLYFQRSIEKAPGRYAALIIEPLVQGAGGMRMCRPEFLRNLERCARESGILLIYDEVMTGFGRTGEWFASIKSESHPDILCLSKGLTGGFLPLALTVVTKEIFDAFYSDEIHHTFFHGHSYTANPVGCAAANATIALLKKNEALFRNLESKHRRGMMRYAEDPRFEKLRFCGTIAALDVKTNEETGYLNSINQVIKSKSLEHGVLLRPLGNTVYLMPPYCITDNQLEKVYCCIDKIFKGIR